MKKRIMIWIIAILLMLCSACHARPNKEVSDNGEAADFNATSVSWFSTRNPVIATENGLYYIMEGWIYYADLSKKKAYPLCFKLGCQHEKEDVHSKCDAYIGTDPNNPGSSMFLGYYNGKLYMDAIDESADHLQLIMMEMDGAERTVVIEDMSSIDSNSLLFHRGFLYFTSNEQKNDGHFVQQIRRVSIGKASGLPEILVEIDRDQQSFYSSLPFLPLADQLYYTVQKDGEDTFVDLFRYDLSGKTETKIAESEPLSIYGGDADKLILSGAEGIHLEYSPETGMITESPWLNKIQDEHPGWQCQAGCINEDFALYFVIRDDIDPPLDPDLKVVDREGKILCEIKSGAHGWTSPQILTIRNEKYLVVYGPDYGQNNSLDLYKVEDLMQGKVEVYRIYR